MATLQRDRQYGYGYGYGYPARANPGTGEEPSVLRHYFMLVRRRFWTVLPAAVIVSTIGILWAYRLPEYYTASATILVERQAPRIAGADAMAPDLPFWDPDFYRTQTELIRTRDVLQNALQYPEVSRLFPSNLVARPDRSFTSSLRRTLVSLLGAVPPPPPQRWELLKGRVAVTHRKDTYLITVSSTGGRPGELPVIANGVARAFVEYHLKRREDLLGDAYKFLAEEKNKQEQFLAEAQRGLQEFRAQAKEVSVSPDAADQPVLRKLSELSEKLTSIQLRRIEMSSVLKIARDAIEPSEGSKADVSDRLFSLAQIRGDSTVVESYRAWSSARADVLRLSDTYGPEHQLMKTAVAEESRTRDVFNRALRQKVLAVESELSLMLDQEESLKSELGTQKDEALSLAKETFTFTQLDNAAKRHQKLYDAMVERLREIDISAGFVRTNVKVVEQAAPPTGPAGPARSKMILFSLVLGLAGGVGLALVFEALDDTIKTPEDLKSCVSLPVLGFLPRIRPADGKKSGDMPAAPVLITVTEPTSSAAEAYRNIRTRLLYSVPAGAGNVMGVTSGNPGEGKTTTCANLAVAMAFAGKKTILIDADIHRPSVGALFGLRDHAGLTDVLAREKDVSDTLWPFPLHDPAVGGSLDVMAAGAPTPNPAELLGSQKMSSLLLRMKRNYDWVFIDIPPVLFISDASIVSAICENVVLVVRSGVNNRSILLRTVEQLADIHTNVLGCVLNDVSLSRLGRSSSYYSYYGYSRYSSNYHKSYYARDTEPEPAPESETKPSKSA